MSYPKMIRVRQQFEAPEVDDIAAAVRAEVKGLNLDSTVTPGKSVAVTVGSRGIANIALIIKSVVEELKSLNLEPFIVPAMGSHGAGVAENQRKIVEDYGCTEEYTGAPIRASMETVQVGTTEDGIPVYFDKHAFEADHVVVVGRVKPHTTFVGEIESGLHKMMLIGLGKHKGAELYHRAIVQHSFDRIVRTVAHTVLEKCGVLFGLGIVENQYDRTALLRAVPPENFADGEKELLLLAKKWMPRLPFDHADLLIVDEMGKNISGSGMDSNVIGRKFLDHRAAEKEFPKITRIYIRDLTEETHGNASGLGTAEFTHKRLVDKLDLEMTYINCLTGGHPPSGAIPIYFDSDRKILDVALKSIGLIEPEDAKVIHIKNTLDVVELLVSEPYAPEVEKRNDLSLVDGPSEIEFDGNGDFLPL